MATFVMWPTFSNMAKLNRAEKYPFLCKQAQRRDKAETDASKQDF